MDSNRRDEQFGSLPAAWRAVYAWRTEGGQAESWNFGEWEPIGAAVAAAITEIEATAAAVAAVVAISVTAAAYS